MSVGWLVRGVGMTWWTHVEDTRWSRVLNGLVGRWEIHTSLICCQVNWLHLRSAYSTILKISRTQKTVLSSGLFSCVSSFFFPFAAFAILCPFSFPTTFDFLSACLLVFPLCTCVFGYFGIFFLFCWIFVSVLEFPVLPTISHGKSKDGIQPFKGPKPAARIANSPENRVYWAASRGRHSPVPSTCPSLLHPPHLKPPNQSAYLKTNPPVASCQLFWKAAEEIKTENNPSPNQNENKYDLLLSSQKRGFSVNF